MKNDDKNGRLCFPNKIQCLELLHSYEKDSPFFKDRNHFKFVMNV